MTHVSQSPWQRRAEAVDSLLAPWAARSLEGRDRAYDEPVDPLRLPFEVDRHRIIESAAFRRLEQKTQVFAPSQDHFRTRLTHSLEVAEIARTLATALRVNETLVEAIALAHDLGHPPFGHAGEAALDECMRAQGGFNHNVHALRVVEYLEHPFPAFRGLNLTQAVRAGLGGHTSRYDVPVPSDGTENRVESVEAQVASLADRLAYDCHDLEDAIGAGFIGFGDLEGLTLWSQASEAALRDFPNLGIHAVRRPVLDELLNITLADAIEQSMKCLRSGAGGEEAGRIKIAPSPGVEAQLEQLEEFLQDRVYCHPAVAAMDARGGKMVRELFGAYCAGPGELPPRFSERIGEQGIERVVCDYISGMTDRFCAGEYSRLAT